MAVDTHIHRISQNLGWVPKGADAETATRHLNVRLPAHLKKPVGACERTGSLTAAPRSLHLAWSVL